MRILFIGDISGKPGRTIINRVLPEIKKKEKIDFVIANCENSAGGLGVTKEILIELQGYGIDFFTSGDHVWKYSEFVEEMYDESLPIVRPYNYEYQESLPGKGYKIIDLGKGGKIVVANFLGQTFMYEHVRNPFWLVDELIEDLEKQGIDLAETPSVIDFHAEATAEKISFANYVKGKISAVLGTHTHVGTVDTRILGGTAFVSDVGMTGPYDSSLWADFEHVTHNFKFPYKKAKQMKEEGQVVLNSVVVEFDKATATNIHRVDRIINL